MSAMRQVRSVIVGTFVLAAAACGSGTPGGSVGTAPPSSGTATMSQGAAASASSSPRFAAGDMVVVLADATLNGENDAGPYTHALVPGDRVLVLSGPDQHLGRESYEVTHNGIDGWVAVASDSRQLLALHAAEPNAPVWDLVKFGDSSAPPSDTWAVRIEKRLGVEVRIHDFWSSGAGGAAGAVLELIRSDADVRKAIADAEVIGIELNPGGTKTGDALGAVCLDGDPTPRNPPPVYTVKDFAEFAGLWRQVYDEIFALRAGKPTIVRAMDIYVPVLDGWTAAGIRRACTAGWEAMSAATKQVAAEYKVSVASIYDAFNGPNHDQDPVDKGYISADGEHPSERGRDVQVDVLDALGYDMVTR